MKMFEFCHRLYPSVKYSLHAGELTRLTEIPEAYKDDDYKMPFSILSLVVNQVYIQMKEYLKKQLIEALDNIDTVIDILSHDEYHLTEIAKKNWT